jgi:hypothetical protein
VHILREGAFFTGGPLNCFPYETLKCLVRKVLPATSCGAHQCRMHKAAAKPASTSSFKAPKQPTESLLGRYGRRGIDPGSCIRFHLHERRRRAENFLHQVGR